MSIIKQSYHFRSFPHPTLAAVPQGVKAATAAQRADFAAHPQEFEAVETAYKLADGATVNVRSLKRKSAEDVEINLPEFMQSLPDDTVRGLVQDCILRFVKTEYVDEFRPVGAHDWPHVCATLAARAANRPSGSSLPEVSDADRALADEFFHAYMSEVAPKFAPHIKGWIAGKCTHTRTEKALGSVTEARTDNLIGRVAQALELAAVPEVASTTEGPAIKAGLELAAEMLKRFKAAKFAPKELIGDDEM